MRAKRIYLGIWINVSKLDVDGKCRPVKPRSLEALLRQYEKQKAEVEALLSKKSIPAKYVNIHCTAHRSATNAGCAEAILIKVSCFAPNYLHTIFFYYCAFLTQILDSIGIVEYAMVGERKFSRPTAQSPSSDKFDASK